MMLGNMQRMLAGHEAIKNIDNQIQMEGTTVGLSVDAAGQLAYRIQFSRLLYILLDGESTSSAGSYAIILLNDDDNDNNDIVDDDDDRFCQNVKTLKGLYMGLMMISQAECSGLGKGNEMKC